MSSPVDYDTDLYSNDLGTATHDRVAGLLKIDAHSLATFQRHGFLAVENAFSAEQISNAILAVDGLIAGERADFRGIQFEPGHGDKQLLDGAQRRVAVRKLMSFVDFDTRLHELAFDAELLKIVSQLMAGADPELFQDMALLKPPGGSEKPWHQDMAYFNVPIETPVIGVWIALESATVENGALRVRPGSHHLGPQEHFKRRDWQICDSQIPRGHDVAIPLQAGGALIWHGLLQHGSPANLSSARRRALQFHYRPSMTQLTTIEERMAIYGGEVRGAEC
ncbi:MAG: phytanoyl-CoA dioxygenase family protein [Gemmatimonadetes bacterium]|jgi:phytanoyl-CoA hydroxylase|nr:phytanoyl-CoA dioxygenase family protein [Gemmatimonadota bacterium]MBT4613256.1 phytanoyl-CoA dioxygenase family protein [Gemmatimonadota bacterium]MBT5056456.1 phytanoyl-CoA dioxygenase family protein [Gemmatimonadota bacterium]MBT5144179.1 phytanoyl-CoA dioxygenase family protein [Gemmatimonadota bacterium]MBT5586651.1 phytanoyl-CoA dioxygenase family protein [Gemmatimonadota bacterium]